jgi:molybdate transport system ATP-binding protein
VAVIFGPSGAGKSTLLETVLGLHRDAEAVVELAGTVLEDSQRGLRLPVQARRLGWVPQEPALMPHLTVEGNLRLGRRRAGPQGEHHLERAVHVLGIGPLLERPVSRLSGGERQRVALARALASGPRALLLDEPLASLDVGLRARVLPYLLRVRDELDLPMLYITHDPDEALLLAEVVAVLDRGRLVAAGEPRQVLWSRAVLPLSEALGLENVLDARVVELRDGGAEVQTSAGLRLVVPGTPPPGERLRLGMRAEDLLLCGEPPGRISARNVLPATVSGLEERNGDVLVHLDARERLVAKITPAARAALGLAVGAPVHVVVKAQAIRRLA